MKTLMLAAIRCFLMFTAVAVLSIAYPASVQAVPTTYQYTGNPFTYAYASTPIELVYRPLQFHKRSQLSLGARFRAAQSPTAFLALARR